MCLLNAVSGQVEIRLNAETFKSITSTPGTSSEIIHR